MDNLDNKQNRRRKQKATIPAVVAVGVAIAMAIGNYAGPLSFDPPTGTPEFTVYIQELNDDETMTFSCADPGSASPSASYAGNTYGCYSAQTEEKDALFNWAQVAVYVCANDEVTWSANARGEAQQAGMSTKASVTGDSMIGEGGSCDTSAQIATASNSSSSSGTIFAKGWAGGSGLCPIKYAKAYAQICISAPPTPTPLPTATPLPTLPFVTVTPGPLSILKNFQDSDSGHGDSSRVAIRLHYSLSPITVTLTQSEATYTNTTYSPLFSKAATALFTRVISDGATLTFYPRDQLTRSLEVISLTATLSATQGISPVVILGESYANAPLEIRQYKWITASTGTTPTHRLTVSEWCITSGTDGIFTATLPVTYWSWLTETWQVWHRSPAGPSQPEDIDTIWQVAP